MTVPVIIDKQVHRRCLYSGCYDPATEDSDYCGPHEAHERGRAANRQRRHRQKLADSGLCIGGCGRKVARQRKPDGTIRKRLCPTCRKGHNKRMRDARARACVTGDSGAVTGEHGGNWRPEYDPDTGAEWQRYRGKGRRGRLTREEQIDEDARDARWAIAEVEKFIAALAALKRPEVLELPPIQRAAVKREVGQYLGTAGRFLDELADKYG